MTNKPQSTLKLRASTLALAAGFALSALPLAVHAAGLGKVTVFSALGQPLRAEVELSATREELSSMKASLASPESFKAAGLDYPAALSGVRFVIDKRASGDLVVRLDSDRPVNEPFVDLLVELNWASGRLVREYTFLLDPPEVAAKAAAPVAMPAAKPMTPKVPEPAAPSSAPPATAPKAAALPATQPAATHEVKRGDTLRKVATANQHEGVSLEQMLVGLYRANKDAFDGGNMNRLKSGRILTVPERAEVEAIADGEARKVVAVQAADWNAYRRKLASAAAQAPAEADAASQASAGRITPKVEDKAAPATESRDQVRVSKTEVGKGKPGAAGEDEFLAKDKALKEANDRLAALEKNVNELQKLLEMKNQSLAELQKQAGKPAVAEASPPEPAKPAAPVAAAKPAEQAKPDEAAKPAETPKAEEAKPAEPPKAAEAAPPPPKPKPRVVPPPPPEEPSFVEELMGNPMLLAGGGGILALLLAYVAIKRRRSAAAEAEAPLAATTADLSQGGLSENSVFRNTGGQSVNTSQTPPQTDFSQAGPGTIDTDEVDPVAEADVYMAYGRDAQAEEILLEAKTKDPKRHAIHLKLLEIYANRQSAAQFDALATELYGDTGGVGGDWEKAAAMGRKLDPQNPLYGGGGAPAKPAFDSDATLVVSADALKSTVAMPGQFAQMAEAAEPPVQAAETVDTTAAAAEPVADEMPASLDFDLGPAAAPAAIEPPPARNFDMESTLTQPGALQAAADADGALDFDLGAETPAAAASPAPAAEEAGGLDFDLPEIRVDATPAAEASGGLDFDLGFDAAATPEPAQPAAAPAEPEPTEQAAGDGLEFDVNLSESATFAEPAATPSFDMASISLDLAEPDAPPEDVGTASSFESSQLETVVNPDLIASLTSQAEPLPAEASEEVSTKLDLAKAYEEMGDLEGARELLQEVLQEGSPEQQATAQSMLDRIAS